MYPLKLPFINKHIQDTRSKISTPVSTPVSTPYMHFPRGTCKHSRINYIPLSELIEPDINHYYSSPCIIEYTDEYYRLFYRVGLDNPVRWHWDKVATCLLTKDIKVVKGSNKYLELHSNAKESKEKTETSVVDMVNSTFFTYQSGHHVEDPRVVKYNGCWFVFYTDGILMGVAKLDLESCDTIYSHYLQKPQIARHQKSDGREKNWIPFVSDNTLYLLYSDTPRTIITCKDAWDRLEFTDVNISSRITSWNYGALRGGSPPSIYDNEHLIWFFHSQILYPWYFRPDHPVFVYMGGAYISKNTYPYEIVKISKLPFIVGNPAHHEKNRHISDCVAFAMGSIKTSNGWRLSIHLNDCEIGILDVTESDFEWEEIINKFV